MPVRAGARAWIHYIQYTYEKAGWPEGTAVHVLRLDGPEAVIRDGKGRETRMQHFLLTAGTAYRGHGGWLPESDPRVREWMRLQVRKLEKERWESGVEDVRLGMIANYRAVLGRA